jgi:hypothetical protein
VVDEPGHRSVGSGRDGSGRRPGQVADHPDAPASRLGVAVPVHPERRPRRPARQQGEHPGGAPVRRGGVPVAGAAPAGPAARSTGPRGPGGGRRRAVPGPQPAAGRGAIPPSGWLRHSTWRSPGGRPGRAAERRSGVWTAKRHLSERKRNRRPEPRRVIPVRAIPQLTWRSEPVLRRRMACQAASRNWRRSHR